MRTPALAALICAALAVVPAAAQDRSGAPQDSAAWRDLRPLIFSQREVVEAGEAIRLDAPYRAHDAATVPIEIEITPPLGRMVENFTIIVDENPAPVAAEFEVGPAMGRVVSLSTRVRVDSYSNVRVVAELDDGSLIQSARFVKASGGCSAPASKDAEAALAAAGQMKLRVFEATAETGEAQVMLRHPQYSGFQMDQLTRLYIPAFFIEDLEVTQGDRLVFRMRGGISLSEDPSIRFGFTPDGDAPFEVRAIDTKGSEFTGAFPVSLGS